jgi:uncharacterized ferritin-like protein (DUF455 family)
MSFLPPTPDWAPFSVAARGERMIETRSIDTVEGVGDRLRTAAFAELQAVKAFRWAADRFSDAPQGLAEAWRHLATEEERHMGWLLTRMSELGIPVAERKVSDLLWHSLAGCTTARQFATFMATAEERGRKAGVRFRQAMARADLVSAKIFGKIAEEEVAHIQLATSFYGEDILRRVAAQEVPSGPAHP